LIPLQDLQARAGELEQYQNQPILIYCATGNRSTTASKILLDKGYKDVMNLRMGIMGWASKGYNIQFQ
jgi:rhodanese-related sulfurtransferase